MNIVDAYSAVVGQMETVHRLMIQNYVLMQRVYGPPRTYCVAKHEELSRLMTRLVALSDQLEAQIEEAMPGVFDET